MPKAAGLVEVSQMQVIEIENPNKVCFQKDNEDLSAKGLVEELSPLRGLSSCKDNCSLLKSAYEENEKLREIFEFGRIEFDKKNQRISELETKLYETEEILKDVQKENKKLTSELEEERAKVLLFTAALFTTGNEKSSGGVVETEDNKSRVAKKKIIKDMEERYLICLLLRKKQ